MQLEFHQLDRRWEHLRVRHPQRQRRLLASLAEAGRQTPIVVVAAEGQAYRYVVIDGYKRITALEQLGRDTVEAVVWPMSEAAAVLLDRSLRFIRTRNRTGGWMVTGGVGAALRLRARRVSAPVRPQCELGIVAAGAGGGSPSLLSVYLAFGRASLQEVTGSQCNLGRWSGRIVLRYLGRAEPAISLAHVE
jgi:uncharacterized ParB-like nuclease family protein